MTDSLLSLLRTFISFRTVKGQEVNKMECLDWISGAFFHSLQQDLIRGEVDGAPYIFLDHPDSRLLWFAHIDVVPAKEEMFDLRIEGDKAFGRGTKDMKGAALPFLIAYSEARAKGHPPVNILLTSDEEVGGQTIPTLLRKGMIKCPVAFTPDTGSTPHIVTEHKGAMWVDLRVEGRGTHGAMPWEGKNPIYLLANALCILQEKFPIGTESDWQMTISPTELRASDARNKVSDTAHCCLDIRYPPEIAKTSDDVLAIIQKELPPGCTLTPIEIADALYTDPSHPMVTLIKNVAEDVTGKTVELRREHGATDARFFARKGIPSFLYGPFGGGIHTEKEWVSIPSLLDQYEICKRLLTELSSF